LTVVTSDCPQWLCAEQYVFSYLPLPLSSDHPLITVAQIPNELKQIYRTVWEISQKSIIEMSADRGA
jgi:hypothetical protein